MPFLLVAGCLLLPIPVSADEAETGTGTDSESGFIQTTDEINSFLITAYRARIDQILADLRKNISGYPIEIQIRVLKQVRISVNEKIEELYAKDISDIRRKILSNVLEYIIDEVQKDIRMLEQQAGQK
ncbi:MAG TPA: hypothetical protein PK765_00865 [bacterium]|nr:hypothetical protein [bacterium]